MQALARFAESKLERWFGLVTVGWRLALVLLVLLVPVLLLSLHYAQDKTDAVALARLEKDGLEYLTPLRRILRGTADHRGLRYRYQLGEHALLPQIEAVAATIDSDFVVLAGLDRRLGQRLRTNKKLAEIETAWTNLKRDASRLPAKDDFDLHTALIESMLELNDYVAGTSGIFIDSHAETRKLAYAIILRGPLLGEKIARLRGAGAGLLLQRSSSPGDRLAIAFQVASTREYFVAIRHALDHGSDYSPTPPAAIDAEVAAVDTALQAFLRQANRVSRGEMDQPTAAAFFDAGSAVLDAYEKADRVVDAAFAAGVDDGIARLEHERRMGMALLAAFIALAVFIALMIVRSIAGPVRHLTQVVKRVTQGDGDARANLDGSDEIGMLARHFDRMMDERKLAETVLRASEAHYRSLAEISTDEYMVFGTDLRCSGVLLKQPQNRAARERYMLGKSLWDLPEATPLSGSWADHRALLAAHQPFRDFEIRYRGSDAQIHYASVSGAPIFGADGSFEGYHALGRIITAQKMAEQKIRDSEANLAAAQHIAHVGSWTVEFGSESDFGDSKGTWSDELYRILGYAPGEIEASPVSYLKAIHPDDLDRVRTPIQQLLKGGVHYAVEHRILRLDGSERSVMTIGETVADPINEKIIRFIGTTQDITERKRAEERMVYLAQFDALTGLPNRHMLYDKLSQLLIHAQRTQEKLACMFVDLDRFKYVNDTFGHGVGDELLVQVADRLKHCLRADDIIGRLGGDEFAIVLASLAKIEDASFVAQKVVATLAAAFNLNGHEVFASGSIGIAIHPDDGRDANTLLRCADTAMYRAKEQGRNNYQFYTAEMNERLQERLQMEAGLHGALERQELFLRYQPKAELDGGTICGFEVLLRWQHPTLGVISPAEFVPVLEDTGMIVAVGEWVLQSVCDQLKSWQAEGLAPPPVAINVSGRQFVKKTLDAFVACIQASGINPALITLELTESLLMQEAEEAVRTLSDLKATGVRLSLDDFGTGYSSLAYLKRFPLDEIKIDRTFVRDTPTNPEDAEIVMTVINLAHSLHLKAVAEGVETEVQLNFLRMHGCDEMQGFYFCAPVPAEDCARMLRERTRLQLGPPEIGRPDDRPTVLIVDDSRPDLELLRRALEPAGYQILLADDPRSALEMLTQHRVAIVISDYAMPKTTGVEFLARVRKLYPDIVRISISGSGDIDTVTQAVNEAAVHKYLSKDWDSAKLRAEVREAYLSQMHRDHYIATPA